MLEQVLLTANDTMITLLCLLSEVNVLIQLFLRRERNGIDTLQAVIGGLAKPVSGRVAHHFKAFDQLGRRNVRTSAQIDQITALVDGDTLAVLNLAREQRLLEWICLEHL